MENKFLVDLSIKYGIDSGQVSKIVDMIYQCGQSEVDSRESQRIANYICEMGLLDKPTEELVEELKLKGFMPD